MIATTLRYALPLAALLLTALPAAAQGPVTSVRESEADVRAMPLEERPNRFGHFYGNTIRRRQQGTLFVNRGKYDRPVARYFYVTR